LFFSLDIPIKKSGQAAEPKNQDGIKLDAKKRASQTKIPPKTNKLKSRNYLEQ